MSSEQALLHGGELPPLRKIASGKVRDIYQVDSHTLLILSTDRISAFDVVMKNGVVGKGKILTQLTAFWLNLLEQKNIVKHHLITTDVRKMPQSCQAHYELLRGRAMLVKRLEMLPLEVIVRGYVAGSGWAEYQRVGTICGHVIPPNMQLSERLPEPIFTPSTKAEGGAHDENITPEQAASIVGAEICEQVEYLGKSLYTAAAEHVAQRGVILADTKMEFGIGADGSIFLGDECFTPDCSRYWPASYYQIGKEQISFDKQYVRDYLKSNGFDRKTPMELPAAVIEQTREKYIEIFRIITGTDPDL